MACKHDPKFRHAFCCQELISSLDTSLITKKSGESKSSPGHNLLIRVVKIVKKLQ
jgi:hypothetical protein